MQSTEDLLGARGDESTLIDFIEGRIDHPTELIREESYVQDEVPISPTPQDHAPEAPEEVSAGAGAGAGGGGEGPSAERRIFFPDHLPDQSSPPSNWTPPIFVFNNGSGGAGDDEDEEEDDCVAFSRRQWELDQEPYEAPAGTVDANLSLKVVHVFSMKSQGNLYTFAEISRGAEVGRKLLAACLSRPVYSMEFVPVVEEVAAAGPGLETTAPRHLSPPVKPKKQEIKFTYIPAGADIVSIDTFSRHKSDDDYVIGITFVKLQPNESGVPVPSGQYLNVYSEWTSATSMMGVGAGSSSVGGGGGGRGEVDLDSISVSCLSIELEFIPYILTHCDVPVRHNPRVTNAVETVFLLSGSDDKIHLYVEDRLDYMFVEVNVKDFFPELSGTFPSVPICIDVSYLGHDGNNMRRLTAVGCECGTVILSLVDCGSSQPTVLNTWKDSLGDGIVSSIKIFQSRPVASYSKIPPELGRRLSGTMGVRGEVTDEEECAEEAVNLLVACTFSPARIFRDVVGCGLSNYQVLERSNCFDTVNCAISCDIDMDGKVEILLGTFGQEMLVYKEMAEGGEWRLIWSRSFSHPILGLRSVDLTGDGVRELAVMTTKGINVLQHDMETLQKLREDRLRVLLSSGE